MATASSKPSQSKASKGERSRTAKLSEMLASEGSPWRPFQETGVLIKAQKSPRDAKAVFAACERRLSSHLKAVCLWPEEQRNETWRIGDYSFWVMFFDPAPKTHIYVQFWGEPDERGAIFEVSSGAWNPPADVYVDAGKQELLRDHGFEIGGNASNFRKIVSIKNSDEVRAVARESIAVLCNILGYDGTFDLGYEVSLQTGSVVGHVLMEVSPDTVLKLLHEWGFVAELNRNKDGSPLIDSRTDHGPFGVLFTHETEEGSGRYLGISLCNFRKISNEWGNKRFAISTSDSWLRPRLFARMAALCFKVKCSYIAG